MENGKIVVSTLNRENTPNAPALAAPTISLDSSSFIFYKNKTISTIIPNSTGTDVSFSISPTLPLGLVLDPLSGEISGTPVGALSETQYTISIVNSGGVATENLSITIGHNFSVNTLTDSNDASLGDGLCETVALNCSLRAAIGEINAGSLPALVTIMAGTFSPSVTLTISNSIILEGAGISNTIITGSNAHQIFAINKAGAEVTLSKLKLTAGNTSTPGGAFTFTGKNLTLSEVDISNNTTSSASHGGGGVYFKGSLLTINKSIFKNNSVTQYNGSLMNGGAIECEQGLSVISDSHFESNATASGAGGAIAASSTITIINSSFILNNASGDGGAVYANTVGDIRRSYFGENKATLFGKGGALFFAAASTNIVVENNTFYNNEALGFFSSGGAIFITGFDTSVLTNNTFVGNKSIANAAGALGINSSFSEALLTNNVFYNNTPRSCSSNGVFNSQGGNLESTNTCQLTQTSDLINTNPQFVSGTPSLNGGPNPTFHFLNTGPLFDSGVDTGCPLLDQRNFPRDDGQCDRGAFELQ